LLNLTAISGELRPWRDYRTIMWIGDTAYQKPEKLDLFFQRLREMGINTAMVTGDGGPKALLARDFPYYVENIVNRGLCLKWNSNVRDWDKFVTDWAKTGRSESALVRDYCLDDPSWLASARAHVQSAVRMHMSHDPVAYDLRDELSVTISANPFDYDFNPIALASFQTWLKSQYPTLSALNTEWETGFKSWDEVKPFTTDQIKNRMASGDPLPHGQPDWQQVQQVRFNPSAAHKESTRWNFAPWADFRTYMDISLSRALGDLRRAAHEMDPKTPVGIEGTQMPNAFGGYDLWRLSRVLDWVEPYDIGNAREIFGSFMPDHPVLTTVFESDTNPARRRLWHLLLEGDRACIIWWSEDCIDWKSTDYQLTPKARALTPALKEMTSPLAQLFLRAEPEHDPVYIHYSQPSIQVAWLLESTVDGSTWLRRFSSFEADHNQQAKARNGWLKAFQDLNFSPQFISSEQIESGALRRPGDTVLVLPESWAMSDKEAAEIRALTVSSPGPTAFRRILCDGPPGAFDEHGKLRGTGGLESLVHGETFSKPTCMAVGSQGFSSQVSSSAEKYPRDRLANGTKSEWCRWLSAALESFRPAIQVPVDARVRVHRYHVNRGQLLALERNVDYHMSEDLRQAGGNESLEHVITTEVTLKESAHVYDLRSDRYLGNINRFNVTIDPWQPSLFAVLKVPLSGKSFVSTLLAQQESDVSGGR
jgi:hypothetical protein